jgi:L-seryl-tRNA(Ser) seleniumtransferase
VTEAARELVAEARERLSEDSQAPAPDSDLEAQVAERAERLRGRHPRPVVNATGVVLHTNLGRSPLAAGAAEAVREVAAAYSDLELDLASGRRGSRLGGLEPKLRRLSGAEAATVCNNNAAAVLLALDSLARGREVVVSRGELVEIGGSFRIPDIMARAGVRLVEVGTTNRTHPRDYENAIGPETGLLLKVHRSNFRQSGFVAEVALAELVAIGRRHELPVMEDLGSGTLIDLTSRGFPPEAFAPSRIALGADVVCFSGDKLLGGPQAGILLGTRSGIDAMRSNPLARALRPDKLCLAALDWTLSAYLEGRAERDIPVLRQLLARPEDLERSAHALAARVRELLADTARVDVEPDRAPVGGGSLPDFELDTWVVAVRPRGGAAAAAAALRDAAVPVLARVRDEAVLFDLRTLGEADVARVEAAVARLALDAAR